MTRWTLGSAVVALGLAWPAGAAEAQGTSRNTAPAVEARLDRTAAWVGDRVTYTIEFRCAPGIDVLEDDLATDRLKLDGLELASSDTSRIQEPDGTTTRQFRFILASYSVTRETATIAPVTVRYYVTRPGQRLQEAAPAGEVRVPAAALSVRSTLPETNDPLELRDERVPAPRPAKYRLAQAAGIALILVAIAPASLVVLALVARRRLKRAARSGRQVRKQERASLEAARAMDPSSVEQRRRIYDQIDALVREHLEYAAALPARSLTASEVAGILAERPARLPAERVAALLAECERARYAPPDQLPSAAECRDALELAGRLVAGRR